MKNPQDTSQQQQQQPAAATSKIDPEATSMAPAPLYAAPAPLLHPHAGSQTLGRVKPPAGYSSGGPLEPKSAAAYCAVRCAGSSFKGFAPPAPIYQEPSTLVADGASKPLCRCRVMYLGSSVPHVTKNGLHGIQEPLRQLYPDEKFARSSGAPNENNTIDISHLSASLGIDSWLSVWSNGLLLENLDEFGRETKRFFAIESLHYCAAVRLFDTSALGQSQQQQQQQQQHAAGPSSPIRFLPLDAPIFQCPGMLDAKHPPIFAAILRRTTGVKVLECHAFICRRDAAANALVRCCTHAYSDHLGARQQQQQQPMFLVQQMRSFYPVDSKMQSCCCDENNNHQQQQHSRRRRRRSRSLSSSRKSTNGTTRESQLNGKQSNDSLAHTNSRCSPQMNQSSDLDDNQMHPNGTGTTQLNRNFSTSLYSDFQPRQTTRSSAGSAKSSAASTSKRISQSLDFKQFELPPQDGATRATQTKSSDSRRHSKSMQELHLNANFSSCAQEAEFEQQTKPRRSHTTNTFGRPTKLPPSYKMGAKSQASGRPSNKFERANRSSRKAASLHDLELLVSATQPAASARPPDGSQSSAQSGGRRTRRAAAGDSRKDPSRSLSRPKSSQSRRAAAAPSSVSSASTRQLGHPPRPSSILSSNCPNSVYRLPDYLPADAGHIYTLPVRPSHYQGGRMPQQQHQHQQQPPPPPPLQLLPYSASSYYPALANYQLPYRHAHPDVHAPSSFQPGGYYGPQPSGYMLPGHQSAHLHPASYGHYTLPPAPSAYQMPVATAAAAEANAKMLKSQTLSRSKMKKLNSMGKSSSLARFRCLSPPVNFLSFTNGIKGAAPLKESDADGPQTGGHDEAELSSRVEAKRLSKISTETSTEVVRSRARDSSSSLAQRRRSSQLLADDRQLSSAAYSSFASSSVAPPPPPADANSTPPAADQLGLQQQQSEDEIQPAEIVTSAPGFLGDTQRKREKARNKMSWIKRLSLTMTNQLMRQHNQQLQSQQPTGVTLTSPTEKQEFDSAPNLAPVQLVDDNNNQIESQTIIKLPLDDASEPLEQLEKQTRETTKTCDDNDDNNNNNNNNVCAQTEPTKLIETPRAEAKSSSKRKRLSGLFSGTLTLGRSAQTRKQQQQQQQPIKEAS